jgi:hypothetical protein
MHNELKMFPKARGIIHESFLDAKYYVLWPSTLAIL